MPTPTIADVTVAAAKVVYVPNTPVIDFAEMEPPDMVAVVATTDVKLPYVDVMLPDVIVLVVRVEENCPVPTTSSVYAGVKVLTPTLPPTVVNAVFW